jgi:hypothetical protein
MPEQEEHEEQGHENRDEISITTETGIEKRNKHRKQIGQEVFALVLR